MKHAKRERDISLGNLVERYGQSFNIYTAPRILLFISSLFLSSSVTAYDESFYDEFVEYRSSEMSESDEENAEETQSSSDEMEGLVCDEGDMRQVDLENYSGPSRDNPLSQDGNICTNDFVVSVVVSHQQCHEGEWVQIGLQSKRSSVTEYFSEEGFYYYRIFDEDISESFHLNGDAASSSRDYSEYKTKSSSLHKETSSKKSHKSTNSVSSRVTYSFLENKASIDIQPNGDVSGEYRRIWSNEWGVYQRSSERIMNEMDYEYYKSNITFMGSLSIYDAVFGQRCNILN